MSSRRAISIGSCSACIIASGGTWTAVNRFTAHVRFQRGVRARPINAKRNNIFRREVVDRRLLARIWKRFTHIYQKQVGFLTDIESTDRLAFPERTRSALGSEVQSFGRMQRAEIGLVGS